MKHILYFLILTSLISCKKENETDSNTFNPPISNIDTIQSNNEIYAIGKLVSVEVDPSGIPGYFLIDWFLQRVLYNEVSTTDLFNIYGVEGFGTYKSKEFYWKNPNIRAKFNEKYGSSDRMYFEKEYDFYKKEFDDFKRGIHKSNPTGYELVRDDISNSLPVSHGEWEN